MLAAVALVIGQREAVLKIVLWTRFVLEELVLQITVNLLIITVTLMQEEYAMAIKQYINAMVQEIVTVQITMMIQSVMV